jgi:hypothetical protein
MHSFQNIKALLFALRKIHLGFFAEDVPSSSLAKHLAPNIPF